MLRAMAQMKKEGWLLFIEGGHSHHGEQMVGVPIMILYNEHIDSVGLHYFAISEHGLKSNLKGNVHDGGLTDGSQTR